MHSCLTGHTNNRQETGFGPVQMVCQSLLYTIPPLRSEALHCFCFKYSFIELEKTREKEKGTDSFLDPKWLRSFKRLIPILNVFFHVYLSFSSKLNYKLF